MAARAADFAGTGIARFPLASGADGWWYSYAQWPSADARARTFEGDPVDAAALAQMQAAILEHLPELVLESVADFMLAV
jgi:hypothetical protein